MEDDNPLGFFGDDLIDPAPVKEKSKSQEEPSLEEWICRLNRAAVVSWITKNNNQEKMQKFLSYDWDNPSERVKQSLTKLVTGETNHSHNPIFALCMTGDPSDGKLLRILLTYGAVDEDNQQHFARTAIEAGKMPAQLLHCLFTHPNTLDPFKLNPDSTLQCVITTTCYKNNVEYFKELLDISQAPQLDKSLADACKYSSLDIIKYLIEERGMAVNEIVCGKTPLQHVLLHDYRLKKHVVDYLLAHGADVNGRDLDGNTVLLYACVGGCADITKLLNSETDLHAKYVTDGVTAFGVAARHQPLFVRDLFEFKSRVMKPDPEFERTIITEVLVHGSYAAISGMWPYATTRDIVDILITERGYAVAGSDDKMIITPIEKFFNDFVDLQEKFPTSKSKWYLMECESQERALWRHLLKSFSRDEVEKLLRIKTTKGQQLVNLVEGLNLLPEEYRLSNQLWSSNIDLNLGVLADVPREIVKLVLSYLTFDEACQAASVSKSWFKEITAKPYWMAHPKAEPSSSNPFRSIQTFIANNRIKTRCNCCFDQTVRIEDGEGLLVMEEGFLFGIKLNGEPIICSWPHYCGSVFRCMVRSRVLSKESIEISVKQIESLLNGGRIEFNSLVDTLLPFLKCLSSNFYDVTVQMQGDYKLFEFASDSNLSEIHEEFPFYPLVYFTQPSDLLNEERIKFYEKQIQSGIRPAALALRAGMEIFVIDGHHKITAYKNLGLLEELVVVAVGLSHAGGVKRKIPVEEEMKYITHAKAVVNRYNQSKKSMM